MFNTFVFRPPFMIEKKKAKVQRNPKQRKLLVTNPQNTTRVKFRKLTKRLTAKFQESRKIFYSGLMKRLKH